MGLGRTALTAKRERRGEAQDASHTIVPGSATSQANSSPIACSRARVASSQSAPATPAS